MYFWQQLMLAELRNLIANEDELIKVFDKLYSDELE